MIFVKPLGAILALALCLPVTGLAGTPERTAGMTSSVGNREEEFHYSSLSAYGEPGYSQSSTLFFNDGFERLTIFFFFHNDGQMTITIRRNMNILWKGTYSVKSPYFSVQRHDILGHITFEITAGEHILYGEIDENDRWDIKEKSRKQSEKLPLPLSEPSSADGRR